MGKVVSFCNQKGGTAKTTSVVNVAAYFGLAGKKTLLIDADPQGNASSGLGIAKDDVEMSLYEVLTGQVTAEQAMCKTEIPHLFVIPANTNLAAAEIELVGEDNREYFLKQITDRIKSNFDYILVDAPPSLGILTLNILTASDSVIVPIQCEYYALEGVSRLVHTLDLVKDRLNPSLTIEGILLTMADFRTRLAIQVIEEVRGFFDSRVYKTVIPRNVTLSEAPSFGKPAYLYDKNSAGAKSYYKLCCEILGEEIKGVYDESGKAGTRSGAGRVDTEERTATGTGDATGAVVATTTAGSPTERVYIR
jgi:chromosome partitioning protein